MAKVRGVTENLHPTRRTVLKGATAAVVMTAVGELRMFDAEAAAAPAKKGVFGYGVASGDPTANAVIIWTRATPSPDATPGSGKGAALDVVWQVARDPKFKHIVRHGTVKATAAHDHTVKHDVTGLTPYTRYYYRFKAKGQTSAVGITQTAPDVKGKTHALRFALVTCSNYTGGYFTAYRAISKRTDLDFVLHVGDYIYEYGNGADRYGPSSLAGKRDAQPATETIDLKGYRLRHAIHKADPDLQAAHRITPWITIFDDHEVANNTWADGAENHQPGEGDFLTRREEAYQAYMEWMPFRMPDQSVPHQGTRFFKRFTFGSLADLSVLETRQNRSQQVDAPDGSTNDGGFVPVGVNPATDAALADPARHLPEPEQMQWLKDGVAAPATWHLIGNQTMLAPIRYPGTIGGFTGTALNSDQWDGYQADQAELLNHLGAQAASSGDVVVLTGDIHSSWAVDLPAIASPGTTPDATYTPVGVEFVTPSVTSDGFYEGVAERFGYGPAAVGLTNTLITGAVVAQSPWVKYFDGVGHGYAVIDVTPKRVQADFFHTPTPTAARPDPRTDSTAVPTYKTSWQTAVGSRKVSSAKGPVGKRADSPKSA